MDIAPSGGGDGNDAPTGTVMPKENITVAAKSEQESTNPFEEYMWMADPQEEDEVNQQVMEEIIEEEFIESCFEDMLEEEALGLFSPPDADSLPEGALIDNLPSLHSLSIDSGTLSDLDVAERDSGQEGEGEEEEEGAGWGNLDAGGEVVAVSSGLHGQNSDGETDGSDSDSLGDTPQR